MRTGGEQYISITILRSRSLSLSLSHSLTLLLACSLLSRGALGREVEAPLLTSEYWGRGVNFLDVPCSPEEGTVAHLHPHDATLGWYLPSSKVRVRSDGDQYWERHGAHWKELPGLELHGQQGPPAALSICGWIFSWILGERGKEQHCVICGGPGQGTKVLSPPRRLLLLLPLGFFLEEGGRRRVERMGRPWRC